jgi:hypothetical protein
MRRDGTASTDCILDRRNEPCFAKGLCRRVKTRSLGVSLFEIIGIVQLTCRFPDCCGDAFDSTYARCDEKKGVKSVLSRRIMIFGRKAGKDKVDE